MYVAFQMKRRAIIGVMGGDEQPKEAAALGSWIVAGGHILLTGGRPIDDATAKNAAMFGAVSKLQRGEAARLIGILPSDTIAWSTPTKRQLFLSTGLGSIERDALTGMTPDLLVFMRSGTGTLLEMAYASAAGKPIVFSILPKHCGEKSSSTEATENGTSACLEPLNATHRCVERFSARRNWTRSPTGR